MKNKLLIALHGFHDSGKTTVLKKLSWLIADNKATKNSVIKLTLSTNNNITENKLTCDEVKAEISLEEENNKYKDCAYIFEYDNKYVSISTSGDNGKYVNQMLSELKKRKCDIIVTATRANGDTVKAVYDYISKNTTDFIPLFKAKNSEDFDDKLVDEIFNIMKLKIGN